MALSRARLGLYILGRRTVFESSFELRSAFSLLLARPDKLTLTTGEMVTPGSYLARKVDDEVEQVATMEGVEHLGQYVFEMTKAKVEALKRGGGVLPSAAVIKDEDEDEDEEGLEYGDGEAVDGQEEQMDGV